MPRIFSESKISAKGTVLPLKDFRLFRELDGFKLDEGRMAPVIKEAEKMLCEELQVLPLSAYREYQRNGNRSNYQTIVNRRKVMALTLAMAESFEKQGRFTEKLMDVVWAIMEESTWLYPAHVGNSPFLEDPSVPPVYGNNSPHGVALCSAGISGTLAMVVHLCRDALDALTPVICDKIIYTLRERMTKPFVSGSFWWMGYKRRANNWCPWIVSNALLTVALTEEDDYTRTLVVERAIEFLDNYTDALPADGGCDEGAGYWSAAGASLFDCLEIIYDMTAGEIDMFSHPFVKAVGEYIVKANICGRRFVNFADCSSKCGPDTAMLIRYGEKCGSAPMVALGKNLDGFYSPSIDNSKAYRTLRAFGTPKHEPTPLVAEKYNCLPNLKVMTARESTDPSKGFFLGIKGGNNAESHNHNDVGNFIVYYDAEPVIIDAGVGAYTKQTFSSKRYELWFMQSGYHNLPSFDGVDQRNGAQYHSEDERFCEQDCSMDMELKNAYPKEAGIISYRRRASLSGGCITLTDEVKLEKPTDVVFHLMLRNEPVKTEEGYALDMGRTLIPPEGAEITVERVSSDNYNPKSNWGVDCLYRVCIAIRTKEGKYTTVIK